MSNIEPQNINEALVDPDWVTTMLYELNQFIHNNMWILVDRPLNKKVIGTKWVLKNKLDVNRNVTRNMARLVAKGYVQCEGIDYDKTFAQLQDSKSFNCFLST